MMMITLMYGTRARGTRARHASAARALGGRMHGWRRRMAKTDGERRWIDVRMETADVAAGRAGRRGASLAHGEEAPSH